MIGYVVKEPLEVVPEEQLDPRLQIIFIGAIVGYYTVLYATLPKWESIRKARAAAAK